MPKTQLTNKISSFLQEEINQLFKQARLRIRYCGVRVLTAPTDAAHARILIVTPKTCGNAPERNLFKRRIRSIFREEGFTASQKNFVVITDKQGVKLSYSQLKQILFSALQNSND